MNTNSTAFITTVLQIVNSNDLLKDADPLSVYNAAMISATLNLNINPNFGYAYIVPYKGKAQFQMGWRGYVQLALRTNQYKEIGVKEVFQGQYIEDDSIRGFWFSWSAKTSDVVIGYVAWFSLLNGFEQVIYMPKDKAHAHGKKYSQTFKNGRGLWVDDFDSMAKKTVLKHLLQKYGILSTEMEKAIVTDQAVIKNYETQELEYVDNEVTHESPEEKKIRLSELFESLEDKLTDPEKQAIRKTISESIVSEYDKTINYLKTK
jgi:recombination protein RecT